jgi:hypothetical protein
MGMRITDLLDDLDRADEAVDNAEGKLGAAHDLMDKLHTDWTSFRDANRDKAVDAIISLLSFDWASLVKQGAKIGITFDSGSSLTSNFDAAVSRVEMLILEMNTAIGRYYTTLGKVQNLIREHNAGHADRGYSPWERHTVPSGPVEPWFVDDDLPDIPCKGGCGVTFSSPSASTSDHKTKCGDGENVDDEARRRRHENGLWGLNHEARVDLILSERSATKGCGRDYYWCTQSEDHKIRFCTKSVGNETCGAGFRRCMPLSARHGQDSYKTYHDDSSSGSGTTSTTQQYVAPDPAPPSTPSMHACGVHETSVSGDHSAASCGISGHYNCDGSDHSLQASCTSTDSNGSSCTVTGFYACQSHTCQYPAPPPQTATCAAGHTYDPGSASDVARHETVRTCRRSRCGQTFIRCSKPTCLANSDWKCWAINTD